MIINNKVYLLTDTYEIVDENMKLLKIKLFILNNKKIDLSFMLYKCKYLKEFRLISEEDKSEQDNEDENIKIKDNFDDLNNKSNIEFLNSYNNNKTNIFNKPEKISRDNNEEEKMNYIINLSDEFLSPSYSSIKSQNNKYREYSQIYEKSFSFKSWKIKIININDNESKKIIFKKNEIIATNMKYMFYGCSSLLFITGLSKINTNNVKNMEHLFENCIKVSKISDISKWNLNKVKDISKMFSGCSSLKSFPDISKWNTNKVENMKGMFSKCSSLKSLPNISNWNFDKLINISCLFS